MYLEGVEAHEEHWGVLGQPGSYRRLCVRCLFHGTAEDPCQIHRNFGTKEGKKSRFGDDEPFAFLGAWLAEARAGTPENPRFANKRKHLDWKPSTKKVREWAARHM